MRNKVIKTINRGVCRIREELFKGLKGLRADNKGVGIVEVILILVNNPFTSSTYILSY